MEETQVMACHYFKRGSCKYGDDCSFLHPTNNTNKKGGHRKKMDEKEVKLPVQLLPQKKSATSCLEFSSRKEVWDKVRLLERYWIRMYEVMDETDQDTLREDRLFANAEWIFASNKIDHSSTVTVDETMALISLPPPIGTFLNTPIVLALNTNKLLQELLSNKADVTSHLWCNEDVLSSWHETLQTNVTVYGGILNKNHPATEDALKSLRFRLLSIALAIDYAPGVKGFRRKIQMVFGMAAFASFYLANTRPYLTGNECLSRLIAVNILDAVAPLPFPLLSPSNTREKYNTILKDSDPSAMMHYYLDCAIFHAERFLFNPYI